MPRSDSFCPPNPTRLLFLMFMFHLMDEQCMYAQQYLTTFARVLDLKVGHSAHALIAGDFNGDGRADLAVAGESQLSIKYQGAEPLTWRSANLFVGKSIRSAAAARLNRDRLVDILLVTDNPPEIRSYLARSSEKFTLAWKKELPESSERMIVADINNDGKADLLFYGKKHLGISVWLGKGNGSFQQNIRLFPEYSISALNVADINGDGVADVMAANWILNQVLIFTGFGKLTFSDPSIISCASEPSFFTSAFLDFDANVDLVIGFPESHSYNTYLGDGLGGYHLAQTVECHDDLLGLTNADVNGDRREDVVALTSQGLIVRLNDGAGILGEPEYFSSGRSANEFALMKNTEGNSIDAAVLDSAGSRLRILYSARASLPSQPDESYGIGFKPRGITLGDINHDGWVDVLTANEGSRSVSLFLGRGKGIFEGQMTFRTAASVERVRYLPKNDSTITFIGFSTTTDSISIIDLNLRTFSHGITTLPTQGPVDLLSERRDTSTGLLHLFAIEHDHIRNSATPIEYEQITATRFIERTYSSLSQLALVTGALCDLNADGIRDFVFLSYNKGKHRLELFFARGKDTEQFSVPQFMFALDVPEPVSATLWSKDVTDDQIPDLVINIQQPMNTLIVSLGKKDTTFSLPLSYQIQSVNISSRDDLSFLDINSNGKIDLVFNNQLSRTLQIFGGKGNGEFIQKMRLISTQGIGGFTMGEVHAPGYVDLLYTDTDGGLLRIINIAGTR
ncbi:MAG: VCBS repeat-containing protein [Ignavibacteriae bacterium]|nr:VCBS repeat-containing protein [Ignavibacteriota bacterium]